VEKKALNKQKNDERRLSEGLARLHSAREQDLDALVVAILTGNRYVRQIIYGTKQDADGHKPGPVFPLAKHEENRLLAANIAVDWFAKTSDLPYARRVILDRLMLGTETIHKLVFQYKGAVAISAEVDAILNRRTK
jgi:hypothetical protein